ncbi:MAG: hypothetical protein A2599_01630 [Candidatus Staskawiczbacteria bacterium RIFOXYD1_FULL_39_28]|uniref:Uncharacterized protein n=1 Tax=Candidatus Staskawiczbacteria bacterium RIFOXYC1_FULL_38_18 TaxID=1802229 RepID=A0A1G2J987_9BACT|nr:MAG: hypothetical protein A2401_00375 [Candidatus Staskawiczbacteria bacterium RIFOXYC1_FULL_38_18]OGZ92018.1 MAG: hypothetical protein A2599_01630 [Candidatus Staskawiczbacteria bacterium RIFOXYD1_FULL_39_28]
MINPGFGLSTITHVAIVFAVKAGNFIGPKKREKTASKKMRLARKIFSAFLIAGIVELVFFSVVGTASLAVYAAVESNRSNYAVVKNVISNLEKNIK